VATDHDSRYKMLFSHPLFVQRLLESFVEEPFTAGLDYSTLERVNASFVSDEFARRESDIIWKATFAGRPLYLFILFEFQSSVDRHMPIRFLRYLAEFYQGFATEHGAAETLPAVFPLLLYNGDARWSGADSVEALIEASLPARFIPHLHYYPVLVNEIPQERLARIHNAVSAVFYVENTEPERLAETIDEVIAILSEEAPEAVERFSLWLQNFLAATTGGQDAARPVRDLTEVRTMFATKLKQYGEELKREAREEEAVRVARRLLARGESVSDVTEITELSEERVRALREEDDTQ
jgi:predicted transposase/invertase (TIGR01784 family)